MRADEQVACQTAGSLLLWAGGGGDDSHPAASVLHRRHVVRAPSVASSPVRSQPRGAPPSDRPTDRPGRAPSTDSRRTAVPPRHRGGTWAATQSLPPPRPAATAGGRPGVGSTRAQSADYLPRRRPRRHRRPLPEITGPHGGPEL